MILEIVVIGHMQVNCYVLARAPEAQAVIIDPGADEGKIRAVLQRFSLVPALIVNTHGHYDHIGSDDAFEVPVYVHKKEKPLLLDPEKNLSALFDSPVTVASRIKTVEEGDVIAVDGIELKVLHTPGHTPGGICLVMLAPEEHIVFTGDTLFFRGIGRTDFPYGDEEALVKNIREKLLSLPGETHVLPGHGSSTTIGQEAERNAFLR